MKYQVGDLIWDGRAGAGHVYPRKRRIGLVLVVPEDSDDFIKWYTVYFSADKKHPIKLMRQSSMFPFKAGVDEF